MLSRNKFLLAMGSIYLGLTSQAFAHTRLSPSSADENRARHATYVTQANIAHGCGEHSVIGHILLMPDQTDSIVEVSSDGGQTWNRHNGQVTDFIQAGGLIRVIKSNEVFPIQQMISDKNGNPIGYWAGGGEGLPPHNWYGPIPFRIQAVMFQDNACAKSITFMPAIADVCEIKSLADPEFNHVTNFWVKAVPGVDPNSTDAKYFGDPNHAYDSPATFKVNRNLTQFPLPANCGQGVDVRIYPSMRQIKEKLKAEWNGQQIWPAP
ncbi:MAG: hypothetical protein N3A55_07530 [Methylohalobius sp.]|nr:hypothetical protein [Methylohalobius sp.]